MTRLTKEIREKITRAATHAAFVEQSDKLKACEAALAKECYEAIFPESIREWARSAPEGWLRKDTCLKINADGYSVTLTHDVGFPVPYSTGCQRIGAVTGDLAGRVKSHVEAKEKKRKEHQDSQLKLLGFLESFATIKQLKQAWPEGEPYYARYNVDSRKINVPATVVKDINAMLGLSKDETPTTESN